MGIRAAQPGRDDRAHQASGAIGWVAVGLAVIGLLTFGLAGAAGLDSGLLIVAAGEALFAVALLIAAPEHGRATRPTRRPGSPAVTTTLNLQPRDDRGAEVLAQLGQTHSPFRWNDGTGERNLWINSEAAPPAGYEAELDRLSPDWREHMAHA